MARVTKAGGTVASYTWDVEHGGAPPQAMWDELKALGKEVPLPPSAYVSRFEVLKALWAEIGIEAIETRELVVERTFANLEDYWQCMVVSSPSGILAAESAELKRRLQARLPVSLAGEITVHSCATAIKGRKAG